MHVLELDLTELAGRIASGDISAQEATRASLDALDGLGRALNCTVATYRDEAMERAATADRDRARGISHGPLHGVPMAHKDLFDVQGRVNAAGSLIRRHHRATGTATAIRRLDAAGAINVGRLHMAEFALSPTGYNGHLGHCRNPWNPDFITGGSSSGSAAAVAARLVPASLGSDTGGSARIPAGACGAVGLKPTYGLIPKDGVTPLSSSLDCISPITRSAADCALLLSVVAGPAATDPVTTHAPRVDYMAALDKGVAGLVIGILPDRALARVDPEISAILDASIEAFRDLGARIVEVDIGSLEPINDLNRVVLVVEAAAYHGRDLSTRPRDFSAHVLSRLETGLYMPATRYAEALTLRGKLARRFVEHAFTEAHLLLLPCMPVPVPTIASDADGLTGTGASDIMDFTRAMNFLGIPAASIPAGFTANGLPASLQLVGRHFDEARILAAAHAFQQATDWHRQAPALVR
ncbi:amidase [Rhodoligotrophos defluvii]|uniref:amidase n=1 Tax=Rhodoligotrophos defluvii TaxID=2561934 RepID=UPI001485AACA|nr:amidase [Rhodoligotrophos defluvii]